MKHNNIKILMTIFCIFFVGNVKASKDAFFNDLSGITTGLIRGIGNMAANQAGMALQSYVSPKKNEDRSPQQLAEKQNKFFKENTYFVVKNDNHLYKYDINTNNLVLIAPNMLAPTPLLQGNIYYINKKYYIYFEKDSFAPATGYFKELNLEDGKIYIYKGVQCKFNKGKLQSIYGNTDLSTNEESKVTSGKSNLKEILREALKVAKDSKIFDISNFDFNEINNKEYKFISDFISRNNKKIKMVTIYANENDEKDIDEEDDDKKQWDENLKELCKRHSIILYKLTRSDINEFINKKFNNAQSNEINLKQYDIGELKNEEILIIYARIINLINNKMDDDEDEQDDKIKISFSAKKVNEQCKKNLKVIMSLAKKYKEEIMIKVITKKGTKTLK